MVRNSTKNCKKHKYKLIALTLLLVALSFSVGISLLNVRSQSKSYASNESAYAVMEVSSNRLLKSSNENAKLPMASTTKALTALIVIENIVDLDQIVTIPKEAVGIEGSSIYLKLGEKISVKDLLYGLMLRSGNDAAVALAIHTAGSVEKFVNLMNEKANSLGLKNSHFVNPHGLSAKNHYTSAYDLCVIASEALKNPTFKEIVSTKMHVVEGENGEESRYFANKNRILYSYEGANGVKTGYTIEAGRCLIASSERNGMQVVAVALNYYDYFQLCANLMDYAHQNYKMVKVIDKNKSYGEIEVKKGKKIKSVEVYSDTDRYYPVKADGSENIDARVSIPNHITAPHDKANSLGEVNIFINNHLIFTEKLYSIYNVDKKFSIF